jgi:hypothetical protein
MEDRPPFHPDNKIYELRMPFVRPIKFWFRKLKLKLYKKRKIKESKTLHQRYYHMKFRINVSDEANPQEQGPIYEMVVPARGAFFDKLLLARSVKEKIYVQVEDWEEITDEEHSTFVETQQEYMKNKSSK